MLKKFVCAAASVLLVMGYGMFLIYYEGNGSNKPPEITVPEGVLELSVQDGEERLLEGLTASDPEDGTLTGEILIDSLSVFNEANERTVRYVVFDRENQPAFATRKITYTDYQPPTLSMTASPLKCVLSVSRMNRALRATSSVDGDISNQVNVSITSLEDLNYSVHIDVADSTGTMHAVDFVCEYDASSYPMDIQLNNYLLFVKKGEKPNLKSNVADVVMNSAGMQAVDEMRYSVQVSGTVDVNKPGVYPVYYYISDQMSYAARTAALVVVEE